jgi:hypothetical protein
MIVLPKETPIIANLNSYYVQVERLIEHFQGEVGCGCLHFYSLSSEGILFFDKDEVLNGLFLQKKEQKKGKPAIDALIQSAEKTNYALNVYILRPDDIYFWSTIPDAKRIYQDLTTEFTDLEGLMKKMTSEGLTGFIDVVIKENNGGGLVFFNNGGISGGSYSWGRGDSTRGKTDQDRLVQLTKDHGGAFHVSRISMVGNDKPLEEDVELEAEELSEKPSNRIVTAMGEMIAIFERTVKSLKNMDSDFATVLNRKFVEKADQYPFLDPFAAEFKYANEKIVFDGDTTDEELTRGIWESIAELSVELNTSQQFKNNLITWMKKYKEEVQTYSINF